MTIYLKEIDGKLTQAPNFYEDETGFYTAFNQNIDLMIKKGYSAFDEVDYSLYLTGSKIFVNGEFINNQSQEYKEKIAKEKEVQFLNQFIEISLGWLRKNPKGYSSIVEAMNSALNVVYINGKLPAGVWTLYPKPDFAAVDDVEKYLEENSFKNQEMQSEDFGKIYVEFMMAWNQQEHV